MPINAFRFGHMPNSVEKKMPNNLGNYRSPGENPASLIAFLLPSAQACLWGVAVMPLMSASMVLPVDPYFIA
jgi:hypothetical protein